MASACRTPLPSISLALSCVEPAISSKPLSATHLSPAASSETQLMPVNPNNSLKRKRSPQYLSSPPPEPHNLPYQVEDQAKEKELSTREEQGLHTNEQTSWIGRGRSPFKTPATAVLDSVKNDARHFEELERDLHSEADRLQKLIAAKRKEIACIVQQQQDISNMDAHVMATKPDWHAPPKIGKPRARSTSPEKQLLKLAHSKPPVVHYTFETFKGTLPQTVIDTVNELGEDIDDGCIPTHFKDVVAKFQPNVREPKSHIGQMSSRSPASIESLCKTATYILNQAQICAEERRDENAWSMNVVRPALAWEADGLEQITGEPGFSRVEYIQTQCIAKSCIQTMNGLPIESKKADFALSFSPQHTDVKTQYDAIKSPGHLPPNLSHMSDICTSKLAIHSGGEVKRLLGRALEGQVQLFNFLAAGIIKVRKLLKKAGKGKTSSELTMPLIGWIVVGHTWEFYVAIGDGNEAGDRIGIFGPIRDCILGTYGYYGVFKLLRIVERIKQWAREKYWPWFCRTVIEPCKGMGGLVNDADEINDTEEGDDDDAA